MRRRRPVRHGRVTLTSRNRRAAKRATDDPVISGIDLAHEYTVAAPAAGLSPDHIRRSQQHALDMAFLPNGEREVLAARKRERAV
jgi:adenosine deaminase